MPFSRLFYHLIWTTKNREPLIGREEEALIRRSFELTISNLDLIPHAIGVMPDHVHVVVSAPPKISPSEIVRRFKGASSREMNKREDRSLSTFAWQDEYGVLSFGERALPTIVEYVMNQPTHHANGTLWPGLERTSDNANGSKSLTNTKPRYDKNSRLEPTSVTEPGN
jgi:putative transposase